jgi:hypothetical protein
LPVSTNARVAREPFRVAFHGLNQLFGRDAVQRGQVRIQHDPLTAKQQDGAFNPLVGD